MSIVYLLVVFIIFGGSNKFLTFVHTSEDENRLIHYLFSEQGYNPLVRPTKTSNETVVIAFGLLLVQLIHVYEKEQIMKTNTWLHMKWYDSELRWNPDRYGGIYQISVPFTNVWTPDVVLFNNADGNYEVPFKSKVILVYTGELQWVPPAIYKSSCRIDVKFFPFDTQECEMRFASWTYNAREVTFTHYPEEQDTEYEINKLLAQQAISSTTDEKSKDDYLESGTWDVIGIPSKFVHYRSNASSVSPDYIEIVFLIKMSRKTLYYTVNLIVPTGLMGILICIVFCLPTAAGEKMTLCMSILLALNLFQLLVTKILPPTSAVVPLIAKYLLFTFTLNVLVIVNTVIITNFYYRTPMTHTMPAWLRRAFLHILPRLLWMESPILREKRRENKISLRLHKIEQSVVLENPIHTISETINRRQKTKAKHEDKNHPVRSESTTSFATYVNDKRRTSTILIQPNSHAKHHRHHRQHHQQQYKKERQKILIEESHPLISVHSNQDSNSNYHRLQIQHMRRELTQALHNIRYIAAHCSHESFIKSIHDEWKFIATVMDRLQFIIFLSVTILGSLALLFQVPDLFKFTSNDSEKLVRFSNPNMTVHELIKKT
ncbi:unnamed protein product [Rotaria magnacalcarata]|uniref:Uncharacterized protein n=6 Tax=Rotaria magnacalcarata TaxID=392030 RepID=A0A814U827_9BILA|nr:unnamed protein product [Rotaria magnacalcarata]CAF1636765.1 unnamed protein product [Rotaria magnacalcarata]CAF2063472.1 unnamed protein product [Rotaria magnacalcarata]CAF2106135.1 unnamed protein product [Rotaria magnacalcarata]CAF2125505.1 unnamed protein product [Rotaria magnacalcarata]